MIRRTLTHAVAFLALAAVSTTGMAANAPQLDRLITTPQARSVKADIDGHRDWANRLLVDIGGIVSPSGQEQKRAEAVAEQMRAIGLTDVRITGDPNVIGRIPGKSGKALVFVSTLDDLATVAEHQKAANTPPRIEGGRIVGPGTNTSLTTVSMLAAAAALKRAGVRPEHDLVFAAVAQEETGLKGMRALYAEYRDRGIGFVDILGDGETIEYGAIAIHWWKVIASGPAGHTLNGGLPNVNQAIGRAVDRILSLPQPAQHADRKTRLNVAILRSGAVFNHKPDTGWFSVDIRSLDAPIVAEIESEVRAILQTVSKETGIALKMEPENMTPGGQIPGALNTPLVRWTTAATRYLGKPGKLGAAGSANLNIAIGGGTSAVGLGGERGGQRGFADEWADSDVMVRTAHLVSLIAMGVGGNLPPPPQPDKMTGE